MFNKLKIEDLKDAVPRIDKTSLFKNMTDKQLRNYMYFYNFYRELFTKYIIKKFDLDKYDKKISNSGLNFVTTPIDTMDMYQYYSSDILKYFYIRNNIYVENLNKEERNFFLKKIKEKNYSLDEETIQMIEKTYPKAIFEDVLKNGEKCKTFYGPDNSYFLKDNNTLIIGFRYNEFILDELSDEEWDDQHKRQLNFCEEIAKEIQEKNKDNAVTPMSILMYDDFSIIKKKYKNINVEREIT